MTSLLGLPTEIIEQIVLELSPPLDGFLGPLTTPDHPGYSLAEYRHKVAALCCLSRTCSTLRRVAQPKLFRSPQVNDHHLGHLVRTLCERPDLAAAVVQLRAGVDSGSIDYRWSVSESESALFNRLLAHHFPGQDVAQDIIRPLSLTEGDRIYERVMNTAFIALAIAQASNVKTLHLVATDEYHPTHVPGSLLFLTELRCVQKHDWNLWFDIGQLGGIIDAAPSLRVLQCRCADGISTTVFHGNVTVVEVADTTCTSPDIQTLMSSFPKLESFTHWGSGWGDPDVEDATPREMLDALQIRRGTLKRLYLDLKNCCYHLENLNKEECINSMAKMDVLEDLHVDGLLICRHYGPNRMSREDRMLLVDFLPSTIRYLGLTSPHKPLIRAALHLADVCQIHFPFLREICLENCDSAIWDDAIMASISDAFAAKGVVCKKTVGSTWQ